MSADWLEVAAFELVRVRIPLRRARQAAHGTMPSERDVVLVRAIGSDGVEGWGECSALEAPTYSGEYTDGAWAVLRDLIVPVALAGGRNRGMGHPMASTSVDVAVSDLSFRRQGVTLAAALGLDELGVRRLAWTAVIGVQSSVDDVLGDVDDALSRGAASVKLKICPGWDLEPVRAVRAAYPDLRISADANGSYERDDGDHLVELARVLAEHDGYLEQPLAAEDLTGLTRLGARTRARVALDESVVSATDSGILGALRNRGLINVKPARLGGVSSTLALAEVVASLRPKRRPETFLGGMFETGVGPVVCAGHGCGDGVAARDRPRSERVVLRRRRDLACGARTGRAAHDVVRAWSEPRAPTRSARRGGGRSPDDPAVSGRWRVEHRSGSAAALHALDWPDPLVPTVWTMEVDAPALVLGSTQAASSVDAAALAREGIALTGRRSGGGAVLVEPRDTIWIDVFVPRGDPQWDDDVNRSFLWLGRAWQQALADVGIDADVHEGALVCGAFGRQVCFAAIGSGELTVGGEKVVGLSQRRTRAGARLQCTVYRRWNPAPLAALGIDPADLPTVATVDVPRSQIESALLAHLP